jgi:hypothetical protein
MASGHHGTTAQGNGTHTQKNDSSTIRGKASFHFSSCILLHFIFILSGGVPERRRLAGLGGMGSLASAPAFINEIFIPGQSRL